MGIDATLWNGSTLVSDDSLYIDVECGWSAMAEVGAEWGASVLDYITAADGDGALMVDYWVTVPKESYDS